VVHCPTMASRRAQLEAAMRTTMGKYADLFRAWGSEGGKIGGKSRMSKLTKEQRRALAKKAAAARWAKKGRSA
jgi:hypothetical protein